MLVYRYGGRESMGTLYFPLNFAVNLNYSKKFKFIN